MEIKDTMPGLHMDKLGEGSEITSIEVQNIYEAIPNVELFTKDHLKKLNDIKFDQDNNKL